MSAINKIFYSLFQMCIIDFYYDSSDAAIFCFLISFSWTEALLLQMHEIDLSDIAFCNDCLADKDSFNECIINALSDEYKLLKKTYINYVWNNNEISCFINYFFYVFCFQLSDWLVLQLWNFNSFLSASSLWWRSPSFFIQSIEKQINMQRAWSFTSWTFFYFCIVCFIVWCVCFLYIIHFMHKALDLKKKAQR